MELLGSLTQYLKLEIRKFCLGAESLPGGIEVTRLPGLPCGAVSQVSGAPESCLSSCVDAWSCSVTDDNRHSLALLALALLAIALPGWLPGAGSRLAVAASQDLTVTDSE